MSALSPNDLLQDRRAQQQQPTEPPVFQSERPVQTPPAQPKLIQKPSGPPIPNLSSIGYWGSIEDFNKDVESAHDTYVKANGVRPDAKTLLSMVVKNGPGLSNMPPAVLPPIGQRGHADVLAGLRNASTSPQGFSQYVQDNSDTLNQMLRDPKMHAKTLASMNASEEVAYWHGQSALLNYKTPFFKNVKTETVHTAVAAAALGKDLADISKNSAEYFAATKGGIDRNNPQAHKSLAKLSSAVEFPNLQKASQGWAQVVKGLVYSPAGVAKTLDALYYDLGDMGDYIGSLGKKGDPTMPRTTKLAKETGQTFYQDFSHPQGRQGYLLLDVWGLLSLGAGTAARLGRAGAALREGGTLGEAIDAARSDHPLQTATYDKGGYSERISLPIDPFANFVARRLPVIGTDDQIRYLQDPTYDPVARLFNPIGDSSNVATQFASDHLGALSPESRMGRAGSIRRATETKNLSYMAQTVEDAAGYAAHSTFLDNVLPDSFLKGLTRGEVKAIQIHSWDVPGGFDAKASAEETLHQLAMEEGIGNNKQHAIQIRDIGLAREAMREPSDRLKAVLQATQDAATKGEELRLAHGLPDEVAEARIREPGFAMQLAQWAMDTKQQLANLSEEESPMGLRTALEQRLQDYKDALGDLDVRYVPENYERPSEVRLSKGLSDKLANLQQKWENLRKIEDLDAEEVAAFKEKFGDAPMPSRKYLSRITERRTILEAEEKELKRQKTREINSYLKAQPPSGTEPGYYAKVGDEWVPVNRGTDDSFYVPILMRGKPARTPMGQIRLPGSLFGIGKNTASPWETHRMTGDALMSGDFRIDTHNLTAQSLSKTVRAIVKIDAWNKAWDAGRELEPNETPGPHEIAIRDVNELPYDLRRSVMNFWEGRLSQDSVDGLPEGLLEQLFPENPNGHVRYIDERALGDLFFKTWERKIGAMEPGVRMLMSPINNTLRPLILYNPKYILNALGNEAMLVFDQGFVRSSQNLARAFGMQEWALEDDYAKAVKLMGAGKASSYISGETKTYGSIASQSLADFWSRISDKNFRLASFLYYADKAGFRTPEEIHALLNPGDDAELEAKMNDIVKRGNDALVAFDRMTPIEKALFRHFVFVYPWTRGAAIWSFRSLMEHPAKSALLATMGQEAYQSDPWLNSVPAWVRRTGYIPFHWTGSEVKVLNPTSINTFSTLSDILTTMKGLIEGDRYSSLRDLGGPAAQTVSGLATGVDANGNAYTGSQLLGAFHDALNMLPLVSSYNRSKKGAGKAGTAYDITSRTGLQAQLATAMKQVTLTPGWLDGWGNILAGGFSPRELQLTPVAARYWATAPANERHQHEVDLLLRQLSIQAQYLKTGKVPSDAEVIEMLTAPHGSVMLQAVPKGVRQAVLDSGQISQINSAWAKKYGTTPPPKQQILNSLKYYKQAGRMSQSVYEKEITSVKRLDATPDLKQKNAAIAVKYGYARDLHEWDRRLSIQASFANQATGEANVKARFGVLYQNGLSKQPSFNLTPEDRARYGFLYQTYLTGRDELKKRLAKSDLTATQRAAELNVYDAKHDQPVKIGGKVLPSLATLAVPTGAEASGISASAISSNQRVLKYAQVPWGKLSSAQKAIFGRKSSVEVQEGWSYYYTVLKTWKDAGTPMTAAVRQSAASAANGYYKGFMQDWIYATKTPKIERFLQSKAYQQMPDKEIFDNLADAAKVYAKAILDGSSTAAASSKQFKSYLTDSYLPWLQKEYPALYDYLSPLSKDNGASWLSALIRTDY